MTAAKKIESLTGSWYVYALFMSGLSVLENGIGIFSLLGAAFSLLVTFALTYFIGKRLLARSSLTRTMMLVLSGLMSVLGVLGVGRLGIAFLGEWSLSVLVAIFMTGLSAFMNIKSIRVLTDSSVKAYIG